MDLATSQALEQLPAVHHVNALAPVESDPLKRLRAAEETHPAASNRGLPARNALCDLLNQHAP